MFLTATRLLVTTFSLFEEHVHQVVVGEGVQVLDLVQVVVAFKEEHGGDSLGAIGGLSVGMSSVAHPLVSSDDALEDLTLAGSTINDSHDGVLGDVAVTAP